MSEPWLELRVHGVSGTAPESMLACDRVTQVSNPGAAEIDAPRYRGRLFRPVNDSGQPLVVSDGDGRLLPVYDGKRETPPWHILEAYHWGGFTSGSWTQALWLLLAPFGIVNTAQFMLEPPGKSSNWYARASHTVAGAALRVIGLALTTLLVLTAAVLTMDLLAWQGLAVTPDWPDWLDWLAALWAPLPGLLDWLVRSAPALALLGPVVVIGVLLLLGKEGTRKTTSAPPAADEEDRASGFMQSGFFEGDSDAPTLRRLHAAMGLGLAALLGFAPGRQDNDSWAERGFGAALILLAAVLVVVTILGDPGHSASIAYRSLWVQRARSGIHSASRFVAWLAVGAGSFLLAAAAWLLYSNPPEHSTGTYPLVDQAAYAVMIVTVTGMIVLLVANAVLAFAVRGRRTSERAFRPFAGGMAAYLVASVGVFLGVGYVGAFVVGVANLLNRGTSQVQPPELLRAIVQSWGITAAFVGLATLLGLVYRHYGWKAAADKAEADFADAQVGLPGHWRIAVGKAIWDARVKNRLVPVLIGFALLGILLSLTSIVALRPSWPSVVEKVPFVEDWARSLEQWPPIEFAGGRGFGGGASFFVGLGGTVLALLAARLVLLGRTAVLSQDKRRTLNVLWDVIAFWPRSAHPLVPVAYSQGAVNDIRERLQQATNAQADQRVVLCGHSQGSLLCFAALVDRPSPQPGPGVGLLTYGSQLQLLFARAFPAYVNIDTITLLYQGFGGRWRNLYRDTDYMAGPVLSWKRHSSGARAFLHQPSPGIGDVARNVKGTWIEYGADWKLPDPPLPAEDIPLADPAPLRKHSDYWRDAAWVHALSDVLPPRVAASDEAESP